MKNLLILRHAKSGKASPSVKDHDRPLNKEGLEQAPRVGALLAKQNLIPEMIISSTAQRAKQTAQLVAENCGFQGSLTLSKELYEARFLNYSDILKSLADGINTMMIVGHNPTQEEFVSHLAGKPIHLSTASLAHLQLNINRWKDFDLESRAHLAHLWAPNDEMD